jgi:DNA (cytosine-5)-methyltransferase 1
MKKPTAISLFAGGGGMTLGMAQAGFETIFASDIEDSSAKTFAHNWPGKPFFNGDARRLTRSKLEEYLAGQKVDLVVGGPPCQGFSTIGDQNPADPRNGLFRCFLRVVQWTSPSCFVMENVNYLRSQYGGRFEKEIVAAFEAIGYKVTVTTLDAADYGVPQHRKRVFFFGTKLDHPFAWPEATHGNGCQQYRTVGDALKGLSIRAEDATINHSFLRHGDVVLARYKLIPEGGRMPPPSELPEEIRRKNFGNTYKRLHRKKPSLTLVPGNNAFPVHPTAHRSLSPREAARLQTFPDEYLFFGSRAEQCKLVGNAVPVELARHLGLSVLQHMAGATPRTESPNVASRPTQLTLELGKVFCKRNVRQNGLTAVSLFTGVGGLMLGFLNAGVRVLGSYDMKNSVARNSELNFPDVPHRVADVGTLTKDQVVSDVGGAEIDVVFGGPPCQGFSIFGRRRFVNTQNHQPDEDERNELSIKYVELAIQLKPKVIFLENVKGFISTQRGNTSYLVEMEKRLKKAGYELKHEVVNCASFGVAQVRERFILVAWKKGLEFSWPEPKFFEAPKPWQSPYLTVGDVISDLMDPATHSDEFSHVPMNHKELVVERYRLIPEGGRLPEGGLPEHLQKGYRSDNVKNFSHVYKRLSMDAPATTMVPGHNAFPVHPVLHRTLTVREAARIQGFPDRMRFIGTRQQQCTLVGNAVPPHLAEIFAVNITKTIKGSYSLPGFKRDIYDLAAA